MAEGVRSPVDVVAAIGLPIGGVFGVAGTFVPQDAFRQTLWAIDAVALVVATALLTVKFGRQGRDCGIVPRSKGTGERAPARGDEASTPLGESAFFGLDCTI